MEESQKSQIHKSGATGFGSSLLLIWDFLKIILIALVIIIPIRMFVFQPFIVSGQSMEPNFSNGEYLIIDEISYHLGTPTRGDVVVMRYPKDETQFFIKRIIAVPGEKVAIDNGKVTIINDEHPQGIVLNELYLPNQNLTYPHDPTVVGGQRVLSLKDDEYFMMGDNRLASSDSRDWGVLRRSEMIGKVFMRALPLNDFKVYTQRPAYGF